MAALLDDEFSGTMSPETVRRSLSGACFTHKKTHRDKDYRNSILNKEKRRQYVVELYRQIGMGKSKSEERAVENNTTGKGKNIHVIACVSERGLEYHESRFVSFKAVDCNAFIERLLHHIAQSDDINEIVLVVDSAQCHYSVENIMRDDDFDAATILKLGPYSPMLNPIENVFSTYKSAVKCFLARNRAATRQVPPSSTIVEQRSRFLEIAADLILREVMTVKLCSSCSRHTAAYHVMVWMGLTCL
uniref:Uncharacterized protein AlNc14C532G12072 n=1 Tax=Albugo laibachii Nc14 TaxID=890382 RepID=F0X0Y2_9STRA|nr:conserved hypothetical protein [Albugo laibachii Nc14]|eukprot:CCA27428.1 conserved hypothetical protein [Albugo laibachii Nc14]